MTQGKETVENESSYFVFFRAYENIENFLKRL